jgi:NTP pyrophosphatase (non-canonical NTP hydrolase)
MYITFKQYQDDAAKFDLYPDGTELLCSALGLAGEAGEFVDKVKKMIRDDGGELSEERRIALIKELGDVMWYTAKAARALDTSVGEVAHTNINKLTDRWGNGTIQGSGDDR